METHTTHGTGFSARSFQKLWDLILNGLSKPSALEYLVDIMNLIFITQILLES